MRVRLEGFAMDVDRVASLRRVPIFSMLESAHLAVLARMTHRQHYRRGHIIYYRGDPGNAMYLLLSGVVKMTLPSDATGSDVLVALLRPGEHFGELAVLDGRPRVVTAEAAEPVEVLAIYRDEVLAFLREHAEASLQVAISVCLRLRHITELLADMAFLDLLPRLAKRLCQLVEVAEGSAADGTTVLINQEALAEMVGATREAVNKQLARLREMGLIETGRGRVRILEAERLRTVASANAAEFTLQV